MLAFPLLNDCGMDGELVDAATMTEENGEALGTRSEADSLFVVGVGASAGGLEALEQFFGVMPEESGLAFVVVQHLSPDFRSVMDELLARRTRIPILLVEDGVRVAANRIYLIPPKKEMIISGGRLLLSDKGSAGELTLPIDIFFRSLAQELGPRAVGVVLSGAGSDGARGIRDIHDAGGLVLVQDGSTAGFDGMPRSAIDTGVADHVLAPGEMARVLVEHRRAPAAPDALAATSGALRPFGVSAALRFLQKAYGIDFSHYKQSTVLRRIERRLQLTQAPALEDYVERLAADPEELDALFRDLLIGVTRFFRDGEAFDCLEQVVLPELLERTPPTDEFRVWVAGCATGEEAYSIAILLQELLARREDRRRVKILATDVHRGSLEFASRGLYDEERLAHVKPALLERYFDRRGPSYQISPELRQLVVFAPHNVVKDAPFTRIDLVSCRNMLIYLQPLAQKKVLSLLHFALKRRGVLILGPSENVGALADDFEAVDPHWRIYRKHRDVRLPRDMRVSVPQHVRLVGAHAEPGGPAAGLPLSQVIGVYDRLLDEYMPPSLLLNEKRELVHAFGGAGKHLKVRDGRPSLDVLDLVPPDLKMVLAGALQKAMKEQGNVAYSGLTLNVNGEPRSHRVSVRPVLSPSAAGAHLLVTLEPTDVPPPSRTPESDMDLDQMSRDQVGSLELELRRTKESLQATIEELETSNEELQATNEELLASNEELQSTNEELQSVNEELYTVNAEYQKKIAELTQLTNDMDNLLASIDVGTVFLDRNLCIRKFTPLTAASFNLLPQDIGRPISGFSNNLRYPRLLEDLQEVLREERAIEREICDGAGDWFFLRILPYRARGVVDGVVLTLIDVNGLKAAEDAVFHERYLLNSLMDSVPDAIYFKDAAGRFIRVNRAMADRLGLARSAEAAGKTAAELAPESMAAAFEEKDRRAIGGEAQAYAEERHDGAGGRAAWFLTTRQSLRDRDGTVLGMLGVARDVTAQKRAEEEIRQAVKRRDDFLAMLSHELRNPLAAIVNAAALLKRVDAVAGGAAGIASAKSPATATRSANLRSMEIIDRQTRQMTRLLDDLLEVSRITQNKIELRREPVDARPIVTDGVAALREKFRSRSIDLAVDIDDAPVVVEADPARLQQIVVNLLDNAAKYNCEGCTVELSLRREGSEAVFRVHDDGPGIDPALLDTVFEPFVQGRATLHRTEGGMGVGLSVVRALVSMHGGRIDAFSDGQGSGCEFVVRLPLASAEPVAAAPPRRQVAWPPGKRVVVIEDNADSCQTLQLLLEQAGYEVFAAADGKSGLETIERERPDIAIVDVGLPIMNGFELARLVRAGATRSDLYLVALTGYGQAADHAAALAAGFDEHLVKPLDPEELMRLVSREPQQ